MTTKADHHQCLHNQQQHRTVHRAAGSMESLVMFQVHGAMLPGPKLIFMSRFLAGSPTSLFQKPLLPPCSPTTPPSPPHHLYLPLSLTTTRMLLHDLHLYSYSHALHLRYFTSFTITPLHQQVICRSPYSHP